MCCRHLRSNSGSKPRPKHFGVRHELTKIVVLVLLLALSLGTTSAYALPDTGSYEYNRVKLLDHILRRDLESLHFSQKKMGPDVSRAAFDLFLKQLDFQKRFLLKEDIAVLRTYVNPHDKEAFAMEMKLAEAGSEILAKRVQQVHEMEKKIIAGEFDFNAKDSIETDNEKLEYCDTLEELRERWVKILKLQILNQYLSLLEDEKSASLSAVKAEKAEVASKPKDFLALAKEKVAKHYEAFFSRTLKEKEREHYDRYFSALARAFDPHTDYMPETNKEDFDISMRGSLEGIGATLKEEDSYIKVVTLTTGGPAYRQGQLKPEDIILRVAEKDKEPVDLTDMKVSDAVKFIRGKKGTEVTLTVRKPDLSQVKIKIVRDVVQLEDSFAKGATLSDGATGKKIGYIKIPGFYRDFEKTRDGGAGRNVTDDVKKELKKLKTDNVNGLIIDLRNNGGGALTDAVKIAGLFIKTGPVVQVKSNNGKIAVLNDEDPEIMFQGPILVLTNKLSASASEILSGALQDYGRAVVLGGEHTHGKGTVQSMVDLNDGIPFQNMDKYRTLGALRVTIQKFYRINGESTQFRGVVPDIPVPDVMNHLKTGEQYLDYPLPWDKVESTIFAKWGKCKPELGSLRAKSEKRVAANEEFRAIQEENKKAVERQKQTVQSLSLDDARKEREESRKLKEKMSSRYTHGSDASKKSSAPMTEAERKELWLKEVNGDVYVKEGIAVLGDMMSADPTCVAVN